MGGIWELLDGKIWEWDLSFRWEWEWDGNGNEVIEMGGNWYEKSVSAHLYAAVPQCRPVLSSPACAAPPSLVPYTNRPFETRGRYSKRLAVLSRRRQTSYLPNKHFAALPDASLTITVKN